MAAPAVLDLQATIDALRAANQGNYDTLTQQEKDLIANEQNQTAGLAAKKEKAFGDITNSAASRGALFSGFSPDAQATYTGNTYLPALANLQKAITESRTAIQGNRNSLDAGIRSEALKEVQGSKDAFQAWQDAQDAATAKAAAESATLAKTQEFTAKQNELDRTNARAVAGINHAGSSTKAPSPGFKLKTNDAGGLGFFNKAGKPITAYQYLKGYSSDGNVDVQDIASLLSRSKDSGDQNIINDINHGAPVSYLMSKYPHVFGG